MDIELPNFELMSLNDTKIYNISESNTIHELFLNICSNENPNITFEEIIEKMIEFYCTQAPEECINKHFNAIITDYIYQAIIANLYESVIKNDYYDIKEYNLYTITSFITCPYGTQYLYDIYTKI